MSAKHFECQVLSLWKCFTYINVINVFKATVELMGQRAEVEERVQKTTTESDGREAWVVVLGPSTSVRWAGQKSLVIQGKSHSNILSILQYNVLSKNAETCI